VQFKQDQHSKFQPKWCQKNWMKDRKIHLPAVEKADLTSQKDNPPTSLKEHNQKPTDRSFDCSMVALESLANGVKQVRGWGCDRMCAEPAESPV